MRAKYHIYLTAEERRVVINSLIDLRNDLISRGKYTDIIDELIIKFTKAKVKKIKIILAFTGSSINTLVYIYSYNYSYYQVLNMYSIGIEIIQGISATLGVILTVPFVAFISSMFLSRRRKRLDNIN
ncbi:YibE/F family protein [Ruminococcus sp.]|uniref:YibE/F family protein n=1 Tax=Ruminococcus sp. TaxID=41978 RepID=UPI00386DE359